MPSPVVKSPLRANSIVFVFLCVAGGLSLQACIRTPSHKVQVSVPGAYKRVKRPVNIQEIPIRVGAYYGSDLREFTHQDFTVGRSTLEIPVGQASVAHFNEVFTAMFGGAVEVDRRPSYVTPGVDTDLSAVIEVRVEDFSYDWRPLSTGPFTAEVTYRFIVYSPDGRTIASWIESGSDTAKLGFSEDATAFTAERATNAIRLASAKFMRDFAGRPGIEKWLADSDKPSGISSASAIVSLEGDAATDLDANPKDITIEATLYSQHGLERVPYHSDGVRSQILAAHVRVKNGGTRSLLIRPADIKLSPRRGTWLEPASVYRVAKRIYQSPEYDASEVIGSAFLTLAEGSAKDSEIKRIKDFFKINKLNDATLAPGESASGFVYYEALGIDGKFAEATLRVRIGESASGRNFDSTLSVGREPAIVTGLSLASLKSGVSKPITAGQSTIQQKEIRAPEQLTIALLPADGWSLAGAGSSTTTEARIHKFARKLLTESGHPMVDRGSEDHYYRGRVWTGGGANKELDPGYAANEGRRLGADAVLTFKYIVRGIGGAYTVDVEVVLVDVTTGRVYRKAGRSDVLKKNTEDALNSFVEEKRVIVSAPRSDVPDDFAAALAALKLSHDQGTLSDRAYMRKQRQMIAEYTGIPQTTNLEKASAPADRTLHIALLPLAHLPGQQFESVFYDFIHKYVEGRPYMTLVYSDYDSRFESGRAGSESQIWSGTMTEKVPNEAAVKQGAEAVGADVALLISHRQRTAGWYAQDFTFTLFVFDIPTNRTYKLSGTDRNYRDVIKSALNRTEKYRSRLAEQQLSDADRLEVRKGTTVGVLAPRFYQLTSPSVSEKEETIHAAITRAVKSNPALTLSYDYAVSSRDDVDMGSVWKGTVVEKVPDRVKVQAVGKALGVDCLVLIWVKNMWARSEGYLYVADVSHGNMYQRSGKLGSMETLASEALSECE